MTPTDADDQPMWPIRAVTERTGIAVGTLRMWERRYGRPVAVRTDTGHRRYTESQVRWLVRVAEALSLGLRASEVVVADDDQLDALLRRDCVTPQLDDPLLAAVAGFDGVTLSTHLEQEAAARPAAAFLDEVVTPFLHAVGAAWADGRIDVAHEHFASGVVSDLLSRRRAGPRNGDGARPVVLATLSGEQHALGIVMAEFVCAARGVPTRFLGPDTPESDVVRTAVGTAACAVAISVSAATSGAQTDRRIAALRDALPADIELLVGGRRHRGVRRRLSGVSDLDDFRSLHDWLASRAEETPDAAV